MVFLERNMKLMASAQPDIHRKFQLPEVKNQFPGMGIGFAQNEKGEIDNIAFHIDGNTFVDNKDAATEWVTDIDKDAHTIIILGFGMGYHVEKLIEMYPDKKIIVIEPDKRVLYHALHLRDLDNVLSGCTIWLDEDILTMKGKIYELVTHPLARGIQFKPYIVLYGKFANDLIMEMQKFLSDWAVMVNTKRCLVDKWYENRIVNAKKESVNAKSLIGKFMGIPALLVGAGPSLQSQLETIKSLQGKAVIIAASTAVEILLSHGITPTFMIAIDQDPVSSGGLHENLEADVPLVFDGQVAQNSLNYKGKKFQMQLNVNRYTGMLAPDLPVFESGPSVANVAMDFLYKLGCSPILMCGVDLSYTYGKLYCDGTQFQQDMSQIQSMKLINNKGEECMTEPSFLSMRNWFTEYINRVHPPVFNCTERGLIIDGVPNANLNDFKVEREHDLKAIIDSCYFKDGQPDYIDTTVINSVNNLLSLELDIMKSMVRANPTIGAQLQQYKAWTIVDEFTSSFIYLEEIKCEDKIKNGENMASAIKAFHDKRTEILLNAIDKIHEMLQR